MEKETFKKSAKLSEEEKERRRNKIEELYNQGLNAKEIYDETGYGRIFTEKTVRNLKQYRSKFSWTEGEERWLWENHRSVSVAEMERKLGRGTYAINSKLKELNERYDYRRIREQRQKELASISYYKGRRRQKIRIDDRYPKMLIHNPVITWKERA